MNTKHTPGPWKEIFRSISYIDIGGNERPSQATGEIPFTRICRVPRHRPADANARLIAAAPDLLEACEEATHALTLSDSCQDEIDAAMVKIKAAIAKATGGAA